MAPFHMGRGPTVGGEGKEKNAAVSVRARAPHEEREQYASKHGLPKLKFFSIQKRTKSRKDDSCPVRGINSKPPTLGSMKPAPEQGQRTRSSLGARSVPQKARGWVPARAGRSPSPGVLGTLSC